MSSRIKRWGVTALGIVLLGSAGYGLMELTASLYYYPSAPDADFPPPADVVEARQQDIEYFRHYLELDKSYTDDTRARAEAILDAMDSRLDDMTDAGFQLEIARAVAAADNGHSNIWLGRFSREHGRLPLRLYWFSDGVYVVRVRADHEDLLGAQLLAVNGVPVDEAAKSLKAFYGGTWESFRAYRGPILLELPVAHAAAGLGASETSAELSFRWPDGRIETRQLDSEQLEEGAPLYWSKNYLAAKMPESESSPWVALASRVESTPYYLQQPEVFFRMRDLDDGGLYIQYRNNYADGIERFADTIRQRAAAARPSYIVVDQRFNGGGDYTKTADIMYELPELVASGGTVYVLTGHSTFSAGINSVAFVKSTGGDRVMIVGERVGDRERSYGETNDFELPNSRLGMTFNTGLHDVEHGCPPFPQCYFRNYFYDVAVGKLDPDMPVETRYSDYVAGIDPVLDTVLALER